MSAPFSDNPTLNTKKDIIIALKRPFPFSQGETETNFDASCFFYDSVVII
jgi:hypothetical protein